MDFLLPLTVIGFIISIYQISEESKKRNLIFKFGLLDKVLLGFFAMILIFTIFSANFWSGQVSETCFNFSLSGGFSVTKSSDSYEITYSFLYSILAFVVSIILIFKFMAKLNSTKLKQNEKFVNNSLDKLGRRYFAEVAADLELFHYDLLKSYKPPKIKQHYFLNYIAHVINILRKNIKFKNLPSPKIMLKNIYEMFILYKEYKKQQQEISNSIGGKLFSALHQKKKKTFIQRFIYRLRFINNRRESYCKLIDNYYYEINGNTEFLEYVAMNNTDLMFMLLDNKLSYHKDDVWSVIGTQLISDKTSKLHKELDYSESGKTKILDFLFNDVNKCVQWLVWKPIGDYIIQHLREQDRKDVDEYNFYEEDFQEKTKNSTLYSGINFFEVMVDQALKQNIHDHMWLMYLNSWVEHILHNISYENHKNAEFLNMYEYYLYRIIDCLRDWIIYAEEDESTTDNDLIIKSAIKSIVNVMEKIYSSKNLRDEFKNYLREFMIENYFKLLANNDHEKMSPYIEKYKESIKEKTHMYPGINQEFIDFLKYPVENYMDRSIWDRGVYSSPELRDSFIQFLDSLSQESNHDVQ